MADDSGPSTDGPVNLLALGRPAHCPYLLPPNESQQTVAVSAVYLNCLFLMKP